MIDIDRLATWMDDVGLPGKGEPIEHSYVSGGSQNEIYEIRRGELHGAVRIGLSTIPLFMLLPTPACKAKRGEVSLSKREVDASLALPTVKEGGPRLYAQKPAVVVRETGNVSVTFDHRVVDGARAGAFCVDVIRRLEQHGQSVH